jgi:glycerol-3-phosphate dehydrogenase
MPRTVATPPRRTVTDLRDRPQCDVLVIGAGINGIATFRDLALNGVDVVVVDRDDYVAGASAASSHMVHGGIRYLENGEFRLVRESVHERNALLRLAPHYVRPLATTIPIFSTFSSLLSAPFRFLGWKKGATNKERGALIIKIGLMVYDTFSRDGGRVPRHQFRTAAASRRMLPQLRDDVKWTATYYDASMHDPERLALDVLADGVAAPTGRAANYVEAVGMTPDGQVELRDVIGGERFTMHPKVVVNASGPWTDQTNAALGDPTRFTGGTKGSHIVLDSPELLEACNGREIFFEFTDGRIVLIYPLKGRVLVGTTDLEHDMTQPIRCTDEEVDYFFGLIAHVFPSVPVTREQIVFRFSGVRPLPRQDTDSTGQISRDYRVESGELGGTPVLSLVGGKWTTFRALGEQLGNLVLERLGRTRTESTDGRLIGGAVGYPTDAEQREAWLDRYADVAGRERADELLNRYGTSAEAILARIGEEGDTKLAHARQYSRTEITHLVETENVVRLLDVLLRRTSIAFVGHVSAPLLDELARLVGGILNWDAKRIETERADTQAYLADHHGIRLDRATTPAAEGNAA